MVNGPDVTAHRAREQPPPSLTCRLMNSRLVRLIEEPVGPRKTMSTHHFLLGHTQTMGHVWSAWGPNSEEGQMVPGIEDRTHINMRKERDRGGGNRYPLSYFPLL